MALLLRFTFHIGLDRNARPYVSSSESCCMRHPYIHAHGTRDSPSRTAPLVRTDTIMSRTRAFMHPKFEISRGAVTPQSTIEYSPGRPSGTTINFSGRAQAAGGGYGIVPIIPRVAVGRGSRFQKPDGLITLSDHQNTHWAGAPPPEG